MPPSLVRRWKHSLSRVVRQMSVSLPQCLGQSILGIVLLSNGVCSGEDATHDASLKLLGDRFSVQLDLQTTEEFLRNVFG